MDTPSKGTESKGPQYQYQQHLYSWRSERCADNTLLYLLSVDIRRSSVGTNYTTLHPSRSRTSPGRVAVTSDSSGVLRRVTIFVPTTLVALGGSQTAGRRVRYGPIPSGERRSGADKVSDSVTHNSEGCGGLRLHAQVSRGLVPISGNFGWPDNFRPALPYWSVVPQTSNRY